jgi:hypothetical protein
MEVPYRNTKLLVKIIPKGTVLFRITDTPENDLRGIPVDGKRCVTPTFNVFFHPNPFIGYYMYKQYKIGDTIQVYKLEQDIKVLALIKPSKYSRMSMKRKTFIRPCSTVKQGCLPKKGNSYDPCFSKTLIEKYPDIVGMLVLAPGDNKLIRKVLKTIPEHVLAYFHKAEDSFGIHEVPELILHPLPKRSTEDVYTTEESPTNYKLIKSIPYNEEKLLKYMKTLTYNPETYFFEG